jgi:hypothetical protein
MQDGIVILQIVSFISVVASGLVILTLIFFKTLRKRLFMRIIAFISVGDLLGNLNYTMQYRPTNGNWWCKLGGFFNGFCYPVSWMWTTVLIYFLHCLARNQKLPLSEFKIHLICWIIPLILASINIFFGGYSSGYFYYEVCSSTDKGTAGFLFHVISYYGLLYLCILIMFGLGANIFYLLQSNRIENSKVVLLASKVLWLYPVTLTLLWTVHGATEFADQSNDNLLGSTVYLVGDALKISCGMVVAIIFFVKSPEARCRWKKLIFSYFFCVLSKFKKLFFGDQGSSSSPSIDILVVEDEDLMIAYDDDDTINSRSSSSNISLQSISVMSPFSFGQCSQFFEKRETSQLFDESFLICPQ